MRGANIEGIETIMFPKRKLTFQQFMDYIVLQLANI